MIGAVFFTVGARERATRQRGLSGDEIDYKMLPMGLEHQFVAGCQRVSCAIS